MPEKLTTLWSDDTLDQALAALHTEVETDQTRLAQTRAILLAEASGRPSAGRQVPLEQARGPQRRWRPLVAAAAVVGLVTTGFFVTTSTTGGSAEARADLDAAASRTITSVDPVIPPGKYLYQVTRTWGEGRLDDGQERQMRVLEESVDEVWIPSDRNQEWILRRTRTGRHQWVVGSDEEAKRRGFTFPRSIELARARCGGFFGAGCDRAGSWQDPTPEWIASLPRDPEALYQRLKKDAPRNERGETELLVYAADALRTGRLPADLRAALYRALGYLDSLRISDRAANLDGRTGVAYGSDDGEFRDEIIVDPATGAFIGDRSVDTDDEDKGQVTRFTSTSGKVVDSAPEGSR